MAGYIFAVSKDHWDSFCSENLEKGFFTPYAIPVTQEDLSPNKRKSRSKILAATFGDFVTMRPGDNVYFLSDRKLYGIGTLVRINNDCKYDNYLGASKLLPDCMYTPTDYLTTHDSRARWVCFFAPTPHFFKKGVDMDDVLRYRPQAFRMLRAFEGLSFIKIDDQENCALKEYISLVNEFAYESIEENTFEFDNSVHSMLSLRDLSAYTLDIHTALADEGNRQYVISEMFIESALLQSLSQRENGTLGDWDHLTHQVIASPFKPLKYIDKIDVFGYRFSQHYTGEPKLITKYLLVELKKGAINRAALEQTMQYVDWICHEYASGDYSKIEAYVLGDSTVRRINDAIADVCQRSFIAETHPAKPEKWNNIKLIRYTINDRIEFQLVEI